MIALPCLALALSLVSLVTTGEESETCIGDIDVGFRPSCTISWTGLQISITSGVCLFLIGVLHGVLTCTFLKVVIVSCITVSSLLLKDPFTSGCITWSGLLLKVPFLLGGFLCTCTGGVWPAIMLLIWLLLVLLISLAFSRVGYSTDAVLYFILSDGLHEGNACSMMSFPLYELNLMEKGTCSDLSRLAANVDLTALINYYPTTVPLVHDDMLCHSCCQWTMNGSGEDRTRVSRLLVSCRANWAIRPLIYVQMIYEPQTSMYNDLVIVWLGKV